MGRLALIGREINFPTKILTFSEFKDMIVQQFYIDKYDWNVTCFYAVTRYYTDEIVDMLIDIGCRGKNLKDAYANLSSGNLNTGLTYSNFQLRETVMVIALTSTPKEFAESWRHEMGHLATHIAQTDNIDPYGEEIQYIGDNIVSEMWEVAHKFLCERCRPKKLSITERLKSLVR